MLLLLHTLLLYPFCCFCFGFFFFVSFPSFIHSRSLVLFCFFLPTLPHIHRHTPNIHIKCLIKIYLYKHIYTYTPCIHTNPMLFSVLPCVLSYTVIVVPARKQILCVCVFMCVFKSGIISIEISKTPCTNTAKNQWHKCYKLE